MRKTILYAFISCSILFFTLSAAGTEDLLDEYETIFNRVVNNYENALRIPESRVGKDYQKTLKNFIRISGRLQKRVSSGGADYNFEILARNIEMMFSKTVSFLAYEKDGEKRYALGEKPFDRPREKNRFKRESYDQDRKRNKKSSSARSSYSKDRKTNERNQFLKENNPLSLFNILTADLKSLRSDGILESGNSFQMTVKECIRLSDFYNRHYMSYLFRINSDYFKREFRRRGELLPRTAQKLMRMNNRRNSGQLPCNLSQEASIILRVTGFYTADLARDSKKGREVFSSHNRQEARTSFERIKSTLIMLSKDFDTARGGATGKKTMLSGITADSSGNIDTENLSGEELKTKLLKIRRKIFEGNTLMNGVDKNTLRKFRVTLTRKEQSAFTKIRKNYATNGYDSEAADRYSCIYILNNPEKTYDKNEVSRVLMRLVKELEKENKKKME